MAIASRFQRRVFDKLGCAVGRFLARFLEPRRQGGRGEARERATHRAEERLVGQRVELVCGEESPERDR
jgi:hypothetical protein